MLLTNLSNAFDFLRHNLPIAKLAAYDFDQPSLCFIHRYLSEPLENKLLTSNALLLAKENCLSTPMNSGYGCFLSKDAWKKSAPNYWKIEFHSEEKWLQLKLKMVSTQK